MTKDEALRMALNGITKVPTFTHGLMVKLADVEAAIKEALAQPEQGPLTEGQINANSFEALTRPIIKWMNANTHPHVTVVITPTSAELLEGMAAFTTDDYVRD